MASLMARATSHSEKECDGGLEDILISREDIVLEEKPFASGSAGMVYKGIFKGKHQVAAKAIFENVMANENDSFYEELATLKALRHRNIVRLFGMATEPAHEESFGKKLYIVTELCCGNLIDLVKLENTVTARYTPYRFAEVVSDVMAGLCHLHKLGLVHLDLKPANLLLAADGSVRICDLGLASVAKGSLKFIKPGTAAYSPPEAFSGPRSEVGAIAESSYDATKFDIFSLAVLFVELWAGFHPWEGKNATMIEERILQGERPDFPAPIFGSADTHGDAQQQQQQLRPVPPPPALRALVERMWHSEPASRPSIVEVTAAFQAAPELASRFAGAGRHVEDWRRVRWESDDEAQTTKGASSSKDALSAAAASLLPEPRRSEKPSPPLVCGWNPLGGNAYDRRKALALFSPDHLPLAAAATPTGVWSLTDPPAHFERGNGLGMPAADDMASWYSDEDQPWATVNRPRKWRLEHFESIVPSKGSLVSSSKSMGRKVVETAVSFSTNTTFLFETDEYWEQIRLPLSKPRSTRWAVWAYLSPRVRLLRCISGFVSKEEEKFPYVKTTLVSVTTGDGKECSGRLVFDLESPVRGTLRLTLRESPFKMLREEGVPGAGFFNLRASFKVLHGAVDAGNHMSLVRLRTGKFLVIDAVDPNGHDGRVKEEIDRLTRGGRLIEAVVATHPFHTLGFLPFFKLFGARHIKFYGTPRHLRRFPEIPWSGDVGDSKTRNMWEEHGIQMRLPCGAEFVDPKPPSFNHFSNVFVFHSPSRCVHNDDTVVFYDKPASKMGLLVSALGARDGQLAFHASLTGPGLTDPLLFRDWFKKLLDEWDFDTLCTAHNGVCRGDARERCRALLKETEPTFMKLSERTAAEVRAVNSGSMGGGLHNSSEIASADEYAVGAWVVRGNRNRSPSTEGDNCECG